MKTTSFLSGLLILALMPTVSHGEMISEYQPDVPGPEPLIKQTELSGIANMNFSGFLLAIRGEVNVYGLVERAIRIQDATFDSNGIYAFEHEAFLTPTTTVALVRDFTGTAGVTDLDSDDDGILDNLTSITDPLDAIGILDSPDTTDNFVYGSQLGGQDFDFTGDSPRLVFRSASVGEFYAINSPDNGQVFNIDGEDVTDRLTFVGGDPFSTSFGEVNPSAVPEPSSFALLSLLGLWGVRRRSRKDRKSCIIS